MSTAIGSPDGEQAKDCSISAVIGTILSVPLGLALLVLPLVVHTTLRHGFSTPRMVTPLGIGLYLLSLALAIPAHEGLHALGYRYIGGVSWSKIHFGILWKTLTPYAHCKAPLQVQAYRWSIMLPGIVLGVIPALVGIVLNSGPLTLWGALLLACACGDLMILWLVRRVPVGVQVMDHPSRIGCTLVSSGK